MTILDEGLYTHSLWLKDIKICYNYVFIPILNHEEVFIPPSTVTPAVPAHGTVKVLRSFVMLVHAFCVSAVTECL